MNPMPLGSKDTDIHMYILTFAQTHIHKIIKNIFFLKRGEVKALLGIGMIPDPDLWLLHIHAHIAYAHKLKLHVYNKGGRRELTLKINR